ncbi:MAG: MgtC/SapB family protein [Patescibacteria group bacterium]|jgi:putative Mg2+ transporter-C (MgtC) family protein
MSQIIILAKVLLAAVLGGLLGWERKNIAEKAAGTKTHALVALGSALFTLLSVYGFFGAIVDPTRIAAQIVVGIGFLGAGMIIVQKGEVRGLTTAADIWVAAAIGMTVAVGWYLVAIVITAVIFIFLLIADKKKYKKSIKEVL